MMKPITEKEVPKVVQAIRQTTSKKVLSKLLTRIRVQCMHFLVRLYLSTTLSDHGRSGGSATNYALAWLQFDDKRSGRLCLRYGVNRIG